MITPRDVEKKTMSPQKRETAKRDLFAFYVGRPLTYILTIPFLYTNISPNTVSYLSFIPTILGFVFLWVGQTKSALVWGWFSFFMWSMLDGVDGNIARYKRQYSKIGDTLDAAAGYFAMALIFLGAGIAAANGTDKLLCGLPIRSADYIVFGGLSSLFTVLPRLIMHKAISSTGDKDAGGVKNRATYSFSKAVALNITSIPGFVQIFLLICILTDTLGLYTIGYALVNCVVMIISLRSVFKIK